MSNSQVNWDPAEIEDLIKVYKTYGFEVVKETERIYSFTYRKSRYFGVDIIMLDITANAAEEAGEIKENYSKMGYAVNLKYLYSLEQATSELYKSFFSYDSTIARLKKKYNDFVNKQSRNLFGNQYQYIDSQFDIYDSSIENSDSSLLNSIKATLNRSNAQLIIIEAAAGYGKTCAAFEILNCLTNNQSTPSTPLFIELAKNRGAKIFRYVLLDEIDSEFPTLNSELVIHEIKNGYIPLIIDGFDELLDKVNLSDSDMSKTFDEVETMLDTIGNLLEGNTKIILTTRRTAIFSGIEFDNWRAKWDDKFNVTRVSLKEPRIKDWIGAERYEKLRKNNIPIQYVANPVLLTYLRNIDESNFNSQIENPELIIDEYFKKMLERERERQNLIMTVERQLEVFKNVVKLLLEFDITVETKEFFKELIKDQNLKLLEYTKTLYSGVEKPSVDSLVDTLATHALLDRKGRDDLQIGFINDFVLGIFIGEIICETPIEKIEKDYSYYMLDLACTAYKVQNKSNKHLLWNKVNLVTHKLQPISVFYYDITLMEGLQRNYNELTINDFMFFHINFVDYKIENSVFIGCYFRHCAFDPDLLQGVTFVDCTFDQCTTTDNNQLDVSKNVSTIKCDVKECTILANYNYWKPDDANVFSEVEKAVLMLLYNSNSETKSQHVINVINKLVTVDSKEISKALASLAETGYLNIRGSNIHFNINKLPIIKKELGYNYASA